MTFPTHVSLVADRDIVQLRISLRLLLERRLELLRLYRFSAYRKEHVWNPSRPKAPQRTVSARGAPEPPFVLILRIRPSSLCNSRSLVSTQARILDSFWIASAK